MKKVYYYFFVEPTQQKYEDNESVKPSFVVPVQTEKKTFEVALFSTDHTIYMLRVMVPNLEEEKISEDEAKLISILKQHLQSVLRITYDSDVSISPYYVWAFREENQSPELSLAVDSKINPNFIVNAENIRATYINTFDIKNQIRLFSDSQDKRIPLQYRYLSLYKLLELEFKHGGKWPKPQFSNFLSQFEKEFKNLKVSSKKLVTYTHAIRDKCAHIKNQKEALGVTELSPKDSIEIETFLPLLITICASLINTKYKGKNFALVSSISRKPIEGVQIYE